MDGDAQRLGSEGLYSSCLAAGELCDPCTTRVIYLRALEACHQELYRFTFT